MNLLVALLFVFAGYFIGAIPTGLVVGAYGYDTDIRSQGSGNIGFTNTLRVLGPLAAAIVLTLDVAKGLAAVVVTSLIFSGAPTFISSPAVISIQDSLVVVFVSAAILIGNNFSIYLRFQGGKGIGVASGIIIGFSPVIAIILLIIWILVIVFTRYVSLASITIAAGFPILMFLFFDLWPYEVFSLLAAILAISRHRANIKRLFLGTELKFGQQSENISSDS